MTIGSAKVSVIIPTYNYGAFLPRALASVFEQVGHNLEVIIVDDGSTDDTPEVARAWIPRIRYIRQPNQGPAAARNRGIAEATGTIVAFLDADDWWLPGKLDRQVDLIHSNARVHACHTAFWVTTASGGRRLSRHWSSPGFHPDVAELLQDCRVNTSTVAVRRSLFDRIGMFRADLGTAEDWNLWLRMTLEGDGIYYLPEPTAWTHIHGRNTHITAPTSVQVERARTMIDEVCREFGSRMPLGFRRDVPALQEYWYARLAYDRGDYAALLRHMTVAVCRRPSLGRKWISSAVTRWWSR